MNRQKVGYFPEHGFARALQWDCSIVKLFSSSTNRAYLRSLALQRKQFYTDIVIGRWFVSEKPQNQSSKSQICDSGFEE
jgi:hypothetical protein